MLNAPNLSSNLRDFPPYIRKGCILAAFPVGGHSRAAFQSAHSERVRVPESFPGGCSFGGQQRKNALTLSPLLYRARSTYGVIPI